MKKFIITLSLPDEQADAMTALWDKTNVSDVLLEALKEFCVERYDAERYLFQRFGMQALDEVWKNKVIEIKNQYQAAKLLKGAEIEEEVVNDNWDELEKDK